MTTKNQKPTEIDAHFKYRCPKCCWNHWISLKEAKTKNFKIVCDCDTVFKPKQIKSLSIEYIKRAPKQVFTPDTQTHTQNTIDKVLLDKCSKILVGYGFENNEANKLICEARDRTGFEDAGLLVKNILENIGDK